MLFPFFNPATEIGYLLRATFTADDQGFADAQVLDTAAEGIEVSSLTAIEKVAGLAISGNAISIPDKLVGGSRSGVIATTGIARSIGLAIKAKVSCQSTSNNGAGLVLIDSATSLTSVDFTDIAAGLYLSSTGSLALLIHDGTEQSVINTPISFSADTYYDVCFIWGGFDSAGMPYQNGDTKSLFNYGLSAFYYDGTNWRLWAKVPTVAMPNSIKAGLVNLAVSTEQSALAKDLAIPDEDLSSLLEPSVLDTFTDTDTTALGSHTPDVDPSTSGWTVASGTITINGNSAYSTNYSVIQVAWIDCLDADGVIYSSGYHKEQTGAHCSSNVMVRFSDTNNYWACRLNTYSTTYWTFAIHETDSGSGTTRASATGVNSTGSMDVNSNVILDGSTIHFNINTAKSGYEIGLSYASATLNQTSTKHGFRGYSISTNPIQWRDFAFYPNGHDGDYSDIGTY